jgi:hypothetical protein
MKVFSLIASLHTLSPIAASIALWVLPMLLLSDEDGDGDAHVTCRKQIFVKSAPDDKSHFNYPAAPKQAAFLAIASQSAAFWQCQLQVTAVSRRQYQAKGLCLCCCIIQVAKTERAHIHSHVVTAAIKAAYLFLRCHVHC